MMLFRVGIGAELSLFRVKRITMLKEDPLMRCGCFVKFPLKKRWEMWKTMKKCAVLALWALQGRLV